MESIEQIITDLKKGFQVSTRFTGFGNFGSSRYEVNDPKLALLYQYCEENNYKHSLYESDDMLFMTISNYAYDTLVNKTIVLRVLKNGSYRFYIKKEWEHPTINKVSAPINIKKSYADDMADVFI